MKKKINYNPFKMIGSYVGVFIGLVTTHINSIAPCIDSANIAGRTPFTWPDFCSITSISKVALIYILVFALIGWAINSAWRKWK